MLGLALLAQFLVNFCSNKLRVGVMKYSVILISSEESVENYTEVKVSTSRRKHITQSGNDITVAVPCENVNKKLLHGAIV